MAATEAAQVTSTATVEVVDTQMEEVVDMEEEVTVEEELAAIACLISEQVFRSRIGVSYDSR